MRRTGTAIACLVMQACLHGAATDRAQSSYRSEPCSSPELCWGGSGSADGIVSVAAIGVTVSVLSIALVQWLRSQR